MCTGKFLAKLALFLSPLFLYAALFVAFEPYNYWGLRAKADEWDNPLPRAAYYRNHPEVTNLIFGDSRFAHFDTDLVKELTGTTYHNLGYGGETLQEAIDLFWYATKDRKLDSVVFGVSFYTFVRSPGNRVTTLLPYVDNWQQYVTSALYNGEMLANLSGRLSPPSVAPAVPAAPDYDGYAEMIYGVCERGISLDDYLPAVIEIAEYCNANGIELTFLTPPLHPSIWQQVVDPLALRESIDHYKIELSRYAPLRDFEYDTNYFTAENPGGFTDGFHLNTQLFREFTTLAFSDTPQHMRIWRDGAVVSET